MPTTTPIHAVYGDDEYIVSRTANRIIDTYLAGASREFALDRVDGAVETSDAAVTAVRACLAAIQTPSMFAARKLVWFKNVSFLIDNRTGKTDATRQALSTLAQKIKDGIPPETALIVTAPAIDKRYALYKAFKAVGQIHEAGVRGKSQYARERDAAAFLPELLKETGLKMDAEAKRLFLLRVGTDTQHMVSELEKLSVYMGKENTVLPEHVRHITSSSRESEAWDLADAVIEKNLPEALIIHARLAFQGVSPILMLVALSNKLRDVLTMREILSRKWASAEQSGNQTRVQWRSLTADEETMLGHLQKDPRKMHPFLAGKTAESAKVFTARHLADGIRQIAETHFELVTSGADGHELIKIFITRFLAESHSPK